MAAISVGRNIQMQGFEPDPAAWWRARVLEHDPTDSSFKLAFDDGFVSWYAVDDVEKQAEQQLRGKHKRGPKQAYKLCGKAPAVAIPSPRSSSAGLSKYELDRLENIRKNEEVLSGLGLKETVAECRMEKRAPKRKEPQSSAMEPTRGSRRLAGERAPDLFVADDEGRELILGGHLDEVSALTAEQQAQKDAERQEAWQAARERAAAAAGPSPMPPSSAPPLKEDFVALSAPFFHLNTFIRSQAAPRQNRAFGLFLKLGIATPGFGPLKGETLELVHQQWPLTADFQEPLRQRIASDLRTGPRINDDNPSSEAKQVALWKTHCLPGAFVMCRHAYRENPFLPAALKKHNGEYGGDVYVLGRVEEMPPPQSDEDRALVSEDKLPDERLAALNMKRCFLHGCARVHYFALGYIDDLSAATRGYVTQVCQPTLQQILKGAKEKEAEHARIRKNLWECATHQIDAQFSTEW